MLAEKLTDLDRADPTVADHRLIDRANERHATVRVILPAVFAVQDDRYQGRRVLPARVADRVQLTDEIVGRHRPRTSLVMKPDLVRHRMVTEDDRQLVIRFTDLPGAIEQFRVTHVTSAVATNLAIGRATQDLLIGRDPLDALRRQERDHRLRDRPLTRPHAARALTKVLGVTFDGAADMDQGIVRVAAAVTR